MRRKSRICTTAAVAITCAAATVRAQDDLKVVVLDTPPTMGGSAHYVANRAPLAPSPLIRLPIGSVSADGWVRHQLELMADGMTGRLTEISKWCQFEGSAWTDPHGKGDRGWEELPYWLKGYIDLGYLLQNERILKESRRWVEAVLASQRPDGYFGGEENREKRDLWPHMVMLYVLRTYHDATGDPRILPFMSRFFKWQAGVPLEDFLPASWQKIRGGDNLDSIHWLYNRTGEPWLLDLARVNHECTANWNQTVASWHGVNIAECFREPGQYWQQSKDIRHLRAAERNYDTVFGIYGQVPGGLYGADENCRPGYVGPRQGSETCAMVEIMYSDQLLLGITGDITWADRCEDVAFNSLPASMTPDLKALHYLTAPNQVQLDRANKAPLIENHGDMFSYSPYEQYRCCQHNVAFGWPYYVEHLWMATQDGGLAATLYAPGTVKAKVGRDGSEVRITESTDYPFGEIVRLKLAAGKPVAFPLMLRVPGWCAKPGVRVNGTTVRVDARPRSWIVLTRTWNDGDEVELSLPMEIRTRIWTKNGNTVSIDRGPLTYSLKIGERWEKYDTGRAWAGWEVFPTTPWNYGLIVDTKDPATSFQVVRSENAIAKQPFTPEAAPIALKARGKKIPQWQMEANGMVGEILGSPINPPGEPEDITLIPMGCARLRISAFPHVVEGASPSFVGRPGDVKVTCSIARPEDPLAAVNDGKVPATSNDRTVPRFTWWDRLGTGEWVQYKFPEPRTISSCEVYWFDDRPGGGCRVPVAWRLLYHDGNNWKPVNQPSGYGTERDKFNRVTFEPVTTSQLRLYAELRPDYSGGILEWRVGE